MIAAVLFDLGDTLINFAHVDLTASFTRAARDTYGLLDHRSDRPMPAFRKYCRHQLRSLRWAYFKSRITGREFSCVDVLRRCSKRLGIVVPEGFYEELSWRWYKPLADASRVDDDARATLAELAGRGLKLGLISNTFVPGTSLDRHLRQAGLLEYFPVRVYSCELGIRKPNRAIFMNALDQLSVAGDESMYVGDRFRVDVLGARRVGMFAVLKSDAPASRRLDDKTFQIENLAQLPDLVDRIGVKLASPTT